MNEEAHVSGAVSAIVMLAAIVTTYNVYSYYKDDAVAVEYEEAQTSMDNTASALMSLRLEKEALTAATAQISTTTEEATEE